MLHQRRGSAPSQSRAAVATIAVEDRLRRRWARGDDPQHLGRRGLLLQRLAELAVALLQLLEQPGVLDGDDGLVRERLQQRDLLLA